MITYYPQRSQAYDCCFASPMQTRDYSQPSTEKVIIHVLQIFALVVAWTIVEVFAEIVRCGAILRSLFASRA